MGNMAVIKVLIVPAVTALVLFLLLTFLLAPLWRKARSGYAHYTPLRSFAANTSAFRTRFEGHVSGLMARPIFRRRTTISDDGISELEEELGEFDATGRRESERGAWHQPDYVGRLSRDLEEGFRDDSDNSDNEDHRRNGRRR